MNADPVEGELGPIQHLVVPPVRDLGDGFKVRRALPSAKQRMVGPFIFLDHFGPVNFGPGSGMQVRPHPHIGLSTLTYLRAGRIVHRDSLGSEQEIQAGDVNWMTAGSGIVHSERNPDDVDRKGGSLFGQQIWVALPKAHEETAPSFAHHAASTLPFASDDGVKLTVVAGDAYGLHSPVNTFSPLMSVNLQIAAGKQHRLTRDYAERAALVVSGKVSVRGESGTYEEGQLVIFRPGAEVVLQADEDAVLLIVGGEPFPERRYIYWNFVSSSLDRIEQAKEDWRAQRFAGIAGDSEYIPLPPDPK